MKATNEILDFNLKTILGINASILLEFMRAVMFKHFGNFRNLLYSSIHYVRLLFISRNYFYISSLVSWFVLLKH